jgi:hypothetical protein
MGEGPEYKPFRELRSVPQRIRRGNRSKSRKGLYLGPFLRKAELGFFHFLEIVTCWLVPSARQKIPVQPG